MGFADSVRKSSQKMQEQLNDKAIVIATDLFITCVNNTPVSDPTRAKRGELKNNWFAGEGKDNYTKSYTMFYDIAGSSSKSEIASLKNSKEFIGKDGEVSITNIVKYGRLAEYVGWNPPIWKGTAPYAMMRNSLTLISAKYKGK